jgi:hypothetical protein
MPGRGHPGGTGPRKQESFSAIFLPFRTQIPGILENPYARLANLAQSITCPSTLASHFLGRIGKNRVPEPHE